MVAKVLGSKIYHFQRVIIIVALNRIFWRILTHSLEVRNAALWTSRVRMHRNMQWFCCFELDKLLISYLLINIYGSSMEQHVQTTW